jgi:uncharacterized DUF497 family protein
MPEFEWDERKRLANLAKHKLDFFDANSLRRQKCAKYSV